MTRRGPVLVALAVAAGALAGCGLGAGDDSGTAALVVQHDFGTKRVGRVTQTVKSWAPRWMPMARG